MVGLSTTSMAGFLTASKNTGITNEKIMITKQEYLYLSDLLEDWYGMCRQQVEEAHEIDNRHYQHDMAKLHKTYDAYKAVLGKIENETNNRGV